MNYSNSPTISKILILAQQGNQGAKEQIAEWMMDEVQAKVLSVFKKEKPSTAQSSLISNVLVKLVRGNTIGRAPSVYYLHAAIANATREILIDLWRQQERRRAKNGSVVAANEPLFRKFDQTEWELVDLHKALDELAAIEPRKAMVVTCRFFYHLSMGQIAQLLGVSKSTVEADWSLARAWLYERLKKDS